MESLSLRIPPQGMRIVGWNFGPTPRRAGSERKKAQTLSLLVWVGFSDSPPPKGMSRLGEIRRKEPLSTRGYVDLCPCHVTRE